MIRELINNQILKELKKYDKVTYEHSVRCAIMLQKHSEAFGISKDELPSYIKGALYHDIGKLDVPLEILCSTQKLSENEWIAMKRHPEKGYERYLMLHEDDEIVKNMILYHHENKLGKGYPSGVTDIPKEAQAMRIVDVHDALTNKRSYKEAMPKEKVLEIITSDTSISNLKTNFLNELS